MTNNSSTGGPLLPNPPPAPQPLEGDALMSFLQQWVANVSGLPGTLVRPRWQAEPPNIPNAATAWAALGITSRPSDKFPFVGHNVDSQDTPADMLIRHEDLNMLVSFYDLGETGQADFYCAQFRDGIIIAQNREVLELAGFNLVESGDPTALPGILNTRWLYRVDLSVRVRRALVRTYPVLDVESADISIESQGATDNNVDIDVIVSQ